jgi:hypothetical protein
MTENGKSLWRYFEGPVIRVNATILDADVYFWTVRLITSDCLQLQLQVGGEMGASDGGER